MDNKTNYLIFILGYDLLHDKFANSRKNECDRVFKECYYIVEEFLNSDEYYDISLSEYDGLQKFLKRKGVL